MNEASEYLEVSIYARVYIKSYGAQENFMPETEEAEVQCHVRKARLMVQCLFDWVGWCSGCGSTDWSGSCWNGITIVARRTDIVSDM